MILNILMRSIWLSFILLVLLLGGCSSKQCGVDVEIFKHFSPQKQEEICELYMKKEAERQKLYEKRRIIEEQNRRLALENENLKLKILYKKYERYGSENDIVMINLQGSLKIGKREYPIYLYEFSIARGEAKKICLRYRYGKACFWVAYYGDELYFNIIPDPNKRWMKRYLIEEDVRTSDESVIIDVDTIRTTTVEFEEGGILYRLRVHIYP